MAYPVRRKIWWMGAFSLLVGVAVYAWIVLNPPAAEPPAPDRLQGSPEPSTVASPGSPFSAPPPGSPFSAPPPGSPFSAPPPPSSPTPDDSSVIKSLADIPKIVEPSPPPPRSSLSPALLAEAKYVGNYACFKCHVEQSKSYSQSTHHRSFQTVDLSHEPPDAEFSDMPSGRSYRVYRKGNQLRHLEFIRTDDGKELVLADHAVRYAVGSGGFALAYLAEANGFFFESPISWYATQRAWKLAPGFESQNTSFGRAVNLDCVFCHTGRVRSVDGGRSRFQIESVAIDCERCHGPGSQHVAHRSAGTADRTNELDSMMIHPGKLARQLSEDICSQCHSNPAAQASVRGRSLDEFQPGMSLQDFRIDFAVQIPGRPLSVIGHSEQLHLSRCFQASPKMTCATCHDPHGPLPAEDRGAHFRRKCLECHTAESCGLDTAKRLSKSKEDHCADCHMPANSVKMPHIAAHHHRIGIHSAPTSDGPPTAALTLVPLQDLGHLPEIERDRSLGLAYLHLSQQLGGQKESEALRQTAQQMLSKVLEKGLKDPEAVAALAQSYQRQSPQRSLELAGQALTFTTISPDVKIKAMFAISDSLLALGDIRTAVQPLQELIRLRRQANDWLLLAVCQYQLENISEALIAAEEAAAIRPDRPNHHALLAELYRKQNRMDLAAEHELLQQLLTPPSKRGKEGGPAAPQPEGSSTSDPAKKRP